MIEVQSIHKAYGKNTVLDGIDLVVPQGKIIGLLGVNGAGKSTLLKIICSIITADTGEVIIDDNVVNKRNSTRIHENLGVLFGSDVGLYGKLTVQENLEYFANLQTNFSKREILERIGELSLKFGFYEYINKKAETLSKGMQQKVVLARAVIHNPLNVVLDEPESGLDYMAVKVVKDFMMDLKNNGHAVLFSSHSLDMVRTVCDEVYLLEKGRLIKIDNERLAMYY